MTEQNQEPQVEETKFQDEVAEVEGGGQGEAVAMPPKKPNKFVQSLDNFFAISARQSSFRVETIGGLTTFFAMCYILLVNPGSIIGGQSAVLFSALYISTAIGAIIGTLLMSLYAKMPYAQAPGMGLNAFFFVSFILNGGIFGFTTALSVEARYQAGMSVIFVAGLVFLLISITGLREKIAKSIPTSLKKAISAGIGLFIAFIGMKNAGLIQFNPFTFVQLGNVAAGHTNTVLDTGGSFASVNGSAPFFFMFTQDVPVTWYTIAPILAAFIGFLIMGILKNCKVKGLSRGNVILGILIATGLFYLFNINNPIPVDNVTSPYHVFTAIDNPGTAFVNWGKYAVGAPFFGFQYWTAELALDIVLLIFTFCLIDMFDTLGTLQGTATEANLLDKDGVPLQLKQCLQCDAIATVTGGIAGTSTVTTFVESSAGVAAGAKTGYASLVTAFMFFIAMFLSPLAAIIPTAATAPALIYVGVLMLGNVKDIDFKDITMSLPSFLIILMMPLTYSISNGIGMGLIAYSVLKFFKVIFSGKEEIKEYYSSKVVDLTEDEIATLEAKEAKKKNGGKPVKKTKRVYGGFLGGDLLILCVSIIFVLRFFLVKM